MITDEMAAEAKRTGGTTLKKPKRPDKPKADQKPAADTAEVKALKGEVTELRAQVKELQKSQQGLLEEVSGLIAAVTESKPFRVKPVRDLNPQSKTYLLVDHYDYLPLKYTRKLDS